MAVEERQERRHTAGEPGRQPAAGKGSGKRDRLTRVERVGEAVGVVVDGIEALPDDRGQHHEHARHRPASNNQRRHRVARRAVQPDEVGAGRGARRNAGPDRWRRPEAAPQGLRRTHALERPAHMPAHVAQLDSRDLTGRHRLQRRGRDGAGDGHSCAGARAPRGRREPPRRRAGHQRMVLNRDRERVCAGRQRPLEGRHVAEARSLEPRDQSRPAAVRAVDREDRRRASRTAEPDRDRLRGASRHATRRHGQEPGTRPRSDQVDTTLAGRGPGLVAEDHPHEIEAVGRDLAVARPSVPDVAVHALRELARVHDPPHVVAVPLRPSPFGEM